MVTATSLHNDHRICLHVNQVFAVTRKINNFTELNSLKLQEASSEYKTISLSPVQEKRNLLGQFPYKTLDEILSVTFRHTCTEQSLSRIVIMSQAFSINIVEGDTFFKDLLRYPHRQVGVYAQVGMSA